MLATSPPRLSTMLVQYLNPSIIFLFAMSYLQQTDLRSERKVRQMTRSRSYKDIASLPMTSTSSNQQLPPSHSIDASRNNLLHRKQYSMTEQEIGEDMAQVMREENLNLKQQNNFLLQKLRRISAKQLQQVELAAKHEAILKQLRAENEQLKQELQYVNELAYSKIEEFGKKLSKIRKDAAQKTPQNNLQMKDLNLEKELQLRFVKSQMQDQQALDQRKNQDLIKKLLSSGQQPSGASGPMQELNTEFQAVLYSCKVEKDNQKRREYRKRLIQLTQKMKQLKK